MHLGTFDATARLKNSLGEVIQFGLVRQHFLKNRFKSVFNSSPQIFFSMAMICAHTLHQIFPYFSSYFTWSSKQCGPIFVMFCAIWYHLYNSKNVKNTHRRVLLLVKLKVTLPHECFSCFLNCTKGTKSRSASHFEYLH